MPSPSESASNTPHPHSPGAVLAGSLGHPSLQSATPSPSLSVSGTPQLHWPGADLFGSFGQSSSASLTPSPSASGPTVTNIPSLPSVKPAQKAIWSMLLNSRGPPLLDPSTVFSDAIVRRSPGATCMPSPVRPTRNNAPAASCAQIPQLLAEVTFPFRGAEKATRPAELMPRERPENGKSKFAPVGEIGRA